MMMSLFLLSLLSLICNESSIHHKVFVLRCCYSLMTKCEERLALPPLASRKIGYYEYEYHSLQLCVARRLLCQSNGLLLLLPFGGLALVVSVCS